MPAPETAGGTIISFLNTAQNEYYPGGTHVNPEDTKATFSSFVPNGETHTCLVIRNPAFDNATSLPLGIQLSSLTIRSENISSSIGTQKKIKPKDLIQDWKRFGLLKTNIISVQPGQRLTVNCDLDVLTKTAISFINSEENGYYEGGVVVETPGRKTLTFSSVVPDNQTRTWLIFRDLAYDGINERTLGVVVHKLFVDVE